MDPQLRSQLRQTIIVRPYDGTVNEYGEESYAAPYSAKCRIHGVNKVVTRSDGTEVVVSFQIVTEARIGVRDQLWFPGESSAGVGHTPVSVKEAIGERGEFDFTEVYL